ncbi:MAG: DHA2 family efflux MFS transporter permease subunit [Bacillota bacterium]
MKYSQTYKWVALAVTTIGGFMAILDTSIVNVALPHMMAAFSVNTEDAEWIITAYMLSMGCVQPATGYLCDRFGTKNMYLFSLLVFTIGSALCGMAWSNASMITFRVLQAVGGGMIMPVTMALIYLVFEEHERNMALGVWGISALIAPAIGPTLSGYLVDNWSWQMIFDINIPIGIVGFLLAFMLLSETEKHPGKAFDLPGFVTSTIGMFCLLMAFSRGNAEGWGSAYILGLFFVAVISLLAFVYRELHTDEPLLDLSLFADWNFSLVQIVVFIGTIALYGGMFLMPLFLQNVLGYSAMLAGETLFPAAAVSALSMPIAALLANKIGAKPLGIAGLLILGFATLPFMYFDANVSREHIMIVSAIRGLGLGLFMMPITVLGMSSVPMNKISRASSLNNVIRQISGSFGIAFLTTLLDNRYKLHFERIAENMQQSDIGSKNFMFMMQHKFQLLGDGAWAAKLKSLSLLSMLRIKQAYIFAFDDTFMVLALIALLSVIPALMLKNIIAKNSGHAMLE